MTDSEQKAIWKALAELKEKLISESEFLTAIANEQIKMSRRIEILENKIKEIT